MLCVWRSKSRNGTPRRSWYRNPSFAESSRSGALSRILCLFCIELDVNGIRSPLGTCACKRISCRSSLCCMVPWPEYGSSRTKNSLAVVCLVCIVSTREKRELERMTYASFHSAMSYQESLISNSFSTSSLGNRLIERKRKLDHLSLCNH